MDEDNYGWIALMYAARAGKANRIKVLLDYLKGQDLKKHIAAKDSFGWTALMHAVMSEKTDSINMLLDYIFKYLSPEAAIEQLIQQLPRDSNTKATMNVIQAATNNGTIKAIEKRIEKEKITLKDLIQLSSLEEKIKKFTQSNPSQDEWNNFFQNNKDSNGSSIIMQLAWLGGTRLLNEVIGYLDKEYRVARIQEKNNSGWTALMYAAYYGKADCMKVLLDHLKGKDLKNYLTAIDNFGWSALMFAVALKNTKCINILLDYIFNYLSQEDAIKLLTTQRFPRSVNTNATVSVIQTAVENGMMQHIQAWVKEKKKNPNSANKLEKIGNAIRKAYNEAILETYSATKQSLLNKKR